MAKQNISFAPLMRFISCCRDPCRLYQELKKGVLPSSFQRNLGAISIEDQIRLVKSKVLVVGCGGLGGFVLELLARLGVGTIFFADGDVFEESNLNRQLYCTIHNIGQNKASEATKRLKGIAPLSSFYPITRFLKDSSLLSYIEKVDIVIDCTGGVEFKRKLIETCQRSSVPIISAAVAGFEGFVTSVTPNSKYPKEYLLGSDQEGAEHILGVLAPTVAFASSVQVSETIGFLCYKDMKLIDKVFYFSLKDLYFEILDLK